MQIAYVKVFVRDLDRSDLMAEHARLSGSGVAFTMAPTKQLWGGFLALAVDPDGNVFSVDEVAAAHS